MRPPAAAPQRAGRQDQTARRAQPERQDQQGEADAEVPVDAARQPDLDDQPGQRQVELHLAEEGGDAVGAAGAGGLLDRHVQLLVEQTGADRREADDQGDELQVARATQHPYRFGAADPLVLTAGGGARERQVARPPQDGGDDAGAGEQEPAAGEQQVVRADRVDGDDHHRRRGHAAEARPAADEAEQSLRLAGVVNVVRQHPELADQEQAEDLPDQIEGHRRPGEADPERRPEPDQQRRDPRLGDRDHRLRRQAGRAARVELHHGPDQHAGDQQHPGQVAGAELADELRPRQRLDDVVGRHHQERVQEHQQQRSGFLPSDLHEGGQQPLDDRCAWHDSARPDHNSPW